MLSKVLRFDDGIKDKIWEYSVLVLPLKVALIRVIRLYQVFILVMSKPKADEQKASLEKLAWDKRSGQVVPLFIKVLKIIRVGIDQYASLIILLTLVTREALESLDNNKEYPSNVTLNLGTGVSISPPNYLLIISI
jgi:hypothetical protein